MFVATAKYHFSDKGFRAITSAVAKLNASRVRVGVLGSDGMAQHPLSKLRVWEIAAIQEFGTKTTPHIPERSFIRRTLQDISWVRSMAARAAQRVVSGKSNAEGALHWLGNVLVTAIQNQIMKGTPPPNKPSTIERKGHDHTLIESGTLSRSITHEVVTHPADGTVENVIIDE